MRYLVIGGDVFSRSDGERHYVSARRLVALYRLDIRECVLADEGDFWPPGYRPPQLLGVDLWTLVILRPRADGDYRLPDPPKPDFVVNGVKTAS